MLNLRAKRYSGLLYFAAWLGWLGCALWAFLAVAAARHGAAATPGPPPPLGAIVVRSTELDINGHVNNAKIVEYLQWGRWDWLARNGFDRARLARDGVALAVVHLDVNYRQELREHDVLSVVTVPTRVGGKSFDLRQEVRRGDATAADAVVTPVTVDVATRRARALPQALRAILLRRGPGGRPDARPEASR